MRTESTPGARGPVFCGVDTHADSHWLCVLDWRGRKVLSLLMFTKKWSE